MNSIECGRELYRNRRVGTGFKLMVVIINDVDNYNEIGDKIANLLWKNNVPHAPFTLNVFYFSFGIHGLSIGN